MNSNRLHVKAAIFGGPLRLWDAVRNAACSRGDKRILIVRHPAKSAHVHRDFFAWTRKHVPQLYERLEFHRVPCRIHDWSRYALHISWAGDTFLYWDQRGYENIAQHEAECRERGIPVINPVTNLARTQKSSCANRLMASGIRVPRMSQINDWDEFRETAAGHSFPLLVREDRGHGKPALFISSLKELRAADLTGFQCPIAVEYIETRSPRDGLYRKYRYLAVGPIGRTRHMIVNDQWEVRPGRRIVNDALRQEELDFVAASDPNEPTFQLARKVLGLDVVGFDYSYDLNGQIVVWEANPFADLNYPKSPLSGHLAETVEATFRMLAAYYVVLAKLSVPAILRDDCANFFRARATPEEDRGLSENRDSRVEDLCNHS